MQLRGIWYSGATYPTNMQFVGYAPKPYDVDGDSVLHNNLKIA